MNSKIVTPELKRFFHQLNNHLAIIDAFLSVMDAENLDDDQLKLYQNARRSFREILGLMERSEE